MAEEYFVVHEDGSRLIRPEGDFAAEGDEVLRIALPNGDVHYVNSGETTFHWEVGESGVLDLLNLADGGRRTIRTYGSWLYADVTPYEEPGPYIW